MGIKQEWIVSVMDMEGNDTIAWERVVNIFPYALYLGDDVWQIEMEMPKWTSFFSIVVGDDCGSFQIEGESP